MLTSSPSLSLRGSARRAARRASRACPAVVARLATVEQVPAAMEPTDDAPFRSKAIAAQIEKAGDIFESVENWNKVKAWLEERLPKVTQTKEGYFSASLAAVSSAGDGAELAQDTQEYATCLWTRDVSNVALALTVMGDKKTAAKAAEALGKLYAREDHAKCMEDMIAAKGEGYNQDTCAPIRFFIESGDRTDPWAHMQLDALGLFLAVYSKLALEGAIEADIPLLERFVRYMDAIEYWSRGDLGHWEEFPAEVLTSSLGCCVAGLRGILPLLSGESKAKCEEIANHGFVVLEERLGGPTGGGAWETEKRREDGAMITLLLPPVADELGISEGQRQSIAAAMLRLRRPHGILRYVDDSYYNENYQARLRAWKEEFGGGNPGAYPDRETRDSWVVPGCEAEWTLFEPLLLMHMLHAHKTEPSNLTAAGVRRSLLRMLAAIEEAPVEGKGDVQLHIHESYTVIDGKREPNDIQDLLWAVAYVRMALTGFADALADKSMAPLVEKEVAAPLV